MTERTPWSSFLDLWAEGTKQGMEQMSALWQAAGIDQRATGTLAGRTLIDLRIQMYVGAKDPEDAIEIEGTPDLTLRIPGGIFGDGATIGRLMSAVNEIRSQPPGLRTVVGLGAFDKTPNPMPIRGATD